MREITYTIKDPNGIHARPAGILVKELQGFTSNITISSKGNSCDGKKLFALMKLRVKVGDEITLKAEGPDEDTAADSALKFLQENL